MANQKRYLFKVTGRTGTFVHATDDWEFQSITRSVNGTMEVDIITDILTKDIGSGITAPMNNVTITVSSAAAGSSGVQYFSGYIPRRALNLRADEDRVVIKVMGQASRLWESLYRNGTTVVMDFSSTGDEASDIAKDIIDKFQTLDADWNVTYDDSGGVGDTIDASGDTVKDKFKLQTCGDALQRCVFLAYDANVIWYWIIKGDDKFYFKKASTTADHTFTFGKDVIEFPQLNEDLQQAKNEIFVHYNGGAAIKRVADATSITNYGNRSLVVSESNVPDSATATEIGNAYLAQLTPPIRTVQVRISDDYASGIESIDPGDTCQILNLPTEIANILTSNMFIAKTTYFKDYVDLELSLKHPQIGTEVQKIRERVGRVETDDVTATTYS